MGTFKRPHPIIRFGLTDLLPIFSHLTSVVLLSSCPTQYLLIFSHLTTIVLFP